ncbi:MAG: hypothetical protein U1E79_03505 [Ottowia sp.]
MEAGAAKARGKPLARLVGYAHAGVDPKIMGIGPVPATKAVLARTGLKLGPGRRHRSQRGLAAQACAVTKLADPARPASSSGISLGHPSAPPARCSPSRRCMSYSASRANTRW